MLHRLARARDCIRIGATVPDIQPDPAFPWRVERHACAGRGSSYRRQRHVAEGRHEAY